MEEIIKTIRDKWYEDCLTYNIPVSSSEVEDIVEELVEMIQINEGNSEVKKYTIDNYEEFCKKALVAPPFDEDEPHDWDEWFETHKIHIVVGNHDIELEYHADNVNEIEYALREMYEVEMDIRGATTGNTVGSEYRSAELKDIVRYFIQLRYENWGGLNWFGYARQAVVEMSDIQSVIGVYEEARKHEKAIDFKCNWHNLKVETLKDATEEGVKKIILDLVGSDLEISYDEGTDKSFIIDYTFKESGDFIGWSWGDLDENTINEIVDSYKERIFEED